MKKKILIFLICFTLIFTSSIYHEKNIQVVKASSLATMISFFSLAMYSSGVTYYVNNGANNLQNDLNTYATARGVTLEEYLSPFQNVVVDVARDAVKYTAAQIYLVKQFCSYLIHRPTDVSHVALNSTSFNFVSLYGYPNLVKVKTGDTLVFHDNDGHNLTLRFSNVSSDNTFIGILDIRSNRVGESYTYHNFLEGIVAFNPDTFGNNQPSGISGTFSINGSSFMPLSFIYHTTGFGYYAFISNSSDRYVFLDRLGSSDYFYSTLDSQYFISSYTLNTATQQPNRKHYEDYVNALKVRFGYNNITDDFEGITLPSYYVEDTVINNIDDSKDLVVTVPEVIDEAVKVAKRNDSNAKVITANDVAIAIDDTVTGVIDNDAEEEEKKVIGPAIDLDRPLDVSQDSTITDTIVEDLVIDDSIDDPNPPDPPDPPIVDIELGSKFPFSVFYDFVAIMNLFDATPVAPSFPLGFEFLGNEYEFTIDLSAFDSVARVLRLMELIAFISGLVFLTIKYIRGKD